MTETTTVERAPLVLVCDDRCRGEQLLRAIGHPDAPRFGTDTVGGWEDTPTDVVVIWQLAPRLVPTRRRLRLVPEGTRAIVVVPQERRGIIELVLRENATVLTWPGTDPALAEELRSCLAEEDDDEAATVASEDLARELGAELSRRLQLHAPRLRLADPAQVKTLVDRLATQVLEEARAASAVPIDDLDFDDLPTTVRPERRLPPPPDLDSLEETEPYTPLSADQADALVSHVESIADDEDVPVAAVSSIPPPLPSTQRPRPMPGPSPLEDWMPYAGLVAAAALLALSAGVAYHAFGTEPAGPIADLPPAASPPTAYLELGTPTVTPVEVPVRAAPQAAPEPEVSDAEPPPAPRAQAEPVADDPEPRTERAFRSAIRARAHRRFGRAERGLDAARFAARLDPDNEEYQSLVADLRAEVESSMAGMDPIEPAQTDTVAADVNAADPTPEPEAPPAEAPRADDAAPAFADEPVPSNPFRTAAVTAPTGSTILGE